MNTGSEIYRERERKRDRHTEKVRVKLLKSFKKGS